MCPHCYDWSGAQMAFTLNWENIAANGSYVLTSPTDNIGLTIATTTNADGDTATATSTGVPPADGLWVAGLESPVTSTLTFDAPVSNFSFEVYNIDAEALAWDDKLTVLVTDAQGNIQTVSFGDLLADPYHSSNGNDLNGDGSFDSGTQTSGAADSVSVTIAGPVSQIQFVFSNGESHSSSGSFGIGNMSLERAALDYVIDGTGGDDVIDDLYLLDPDGDRVDAGDALDGSDDDVIHAGAGDDLVVAGAGNDTIIGGIGSDTLYGDVETDSDYLVRGDSVAGPGGNDELRGGDGDDFLYGGSGDDSLYGDDGNDSILGGHGNDLLYGGAGNDDLEGLYGDDTIYGGDGDDHVFGRDGADLIYGGDGNDTLIGSIGIDTLYGGAGDDVLAGSQGSDLIYGGDGNDLVYIGVPASGDIAYDNEGIIHLDAGNDFLDAGDATLKFLAYGGDGNDLMRAGLGNDTMFGDADNDSMSGGEGDDQLTGGSGRDTIDGGGGDDTFFYENGFGYDTVIGGETSEVSGDTLDASAVTDDITLDLSAGVPSDPESGTLMAGASAASSVTFSEIESISLGTGDDRVIGSSSADNVSTGAGADTVAGGAGDDVFDIGAADGVADTVILVDGDGADTITGFEGPTANGDGTFAGHDLLDVSGLTNVGGDPISAQDVVVTDTSGDGTGDAILTFPNGESVTLVGVSPSALATPAQLAAIGIPVLNTVDGTSADDTMSAGYTDAQGDEIDGVDGVNDTIYGYAGDDDIFAGDGDDLVFGGDGNDTLAGGDGADTLSGGDGRDVFYGDVGDVIDGGEGGDDRDTLNLSNLGGPAMTNVIYNPTDSEAGTVAVLDGSGAVVGTFEFKNIEKVIPCFTPGTLIATKQGETPVEDLTVGDKVLTRDKGYQPIRWLGRRDLTTQDLALRPNFNPILIRAGALGNGLPERDMTVSPQHRMLISSWQSEMLFGEREVLAAAIHLVNDHDIIRIRPKEVSYIHLMLDEHEVILGNGAWTESFQLGPQMFSEMEDAQATELLALFPELEQDAFLPAARMSLKRHEFAILNRSLKES